jgi:TRAP-type C4-dicarboxylate transport system permease large subunit
VHGEAVSCRLGNPVCCLLSAVCCLLSAVCCLLSAVCCLLSAVPPPAPLCRASPVTDYHFACYTVITLLLHCCRPWLHCCCHTLTGHLPLPTFLRGESATEAWFDSLGSLAYEQVCLLSVVCCLLSVVCCLLSVVCCLLSAVCSLLPVVCCLLSAVCLTFPRLLSLRTGHRITSLLLPLLLQLLLPSFYLSGPISSML